MSKKLNLNDFINKKYGCLTIIGVTKQNTNVRRSIVRVKCDCGRESDKILASVLKLMNSCSKKCDFFQAGHAEKTADKYIGKKFNYLKIISYAGRRTKHLDNGGVCHRIIVKCECECGQIINADLYSVTREKITSCGKCNLARCNHKETANGDIIGIRLISIYNNITKSRSANINKDQLSEEWFNDEDPISAIHNFMNYCRPLYEKCMNDDSQKKIYIHRIDIDKPLGPDNAYFDHHIINTNYPGRVYY